MTKLRPELALLIVSSVLLGACAGATDEDTAGAAEGSLTEAKIAQLAIGRAHGCALTADHAVRCWGASNYGQTGAPGGGSGDQPTGVEVFPPQSPIRAIAAGENTTCAVLNDGSISCWGAILGVKSKPGYDAQFTRTPVKVPGLVDVAELVVGSQRACARTNAGAVHCWGGSDETPVLTISSGATALATGWKTFRSTRSGHDGRVPRNYVSWIHALVNGAVHVWGSDIEAGVPESTPHVLPGLDSGIVEISSSCALKSDGAMYCWGPGVIAPNETRPISLGTTDPSMQGSPWTVVKVDGLPTGVKRLVTSEETSCALTTSGEVWCWGANDTGQAGIGNDAYVAAPTKVTLPDVASELEASKLAGFCARLASGDAHCWGDATYGRVGNAPWNAVSAPERGIENVLSVDAPARVTMIDASVTARSMTAGTFYTCGISRAGEGRCWPSSIRRASSAEAPWTFAGQISQIAQQDFGVCAVANDGHVTCRGDDVADVPPGVPFEKVVLSNGHACGIRKNTRGVVCWGKGLTTFPAFGELVANLGPELSAGVQNLFAPSPASYEHRAHAILCALTAAGEVRCFGHEEKTINYVTTRQPVAAYTVQTDVVAVAESSSCIKKQNGTVFCPVKDMKLSQWEPSSLAWAFHEAGLDYGRSFDH